MLKHWHTDGWYPGNYMSPAIFYEHCRWYIYIYRITQFQYNVIYNNIINYSINYTTTFQNFSSVINVIHDDTFIIMIYWNCVIILLAFKYREYLMKTIPEKRWVHYISYIRFSQEWCWNMIDLFWQTEDFVSFVFER